MTKLCFTIFSWANIRFITIGSSFGYFCLILAICLKCLELMFYCFLFVLIRCEFFYRNNIKTIVKDG